MNLEKIGNFIKNKRKEKNLTQQELADKLLVTEKAISRWETGRGTPDISLLIPLSQELNVEISDILNGEITNKDIKTTSIIEYIELNKKGKYNLPFKLSITCYITSLLIFLIYLKFEYNPTININYFYRLILVIISSLFIIIGNINLQNNYIDKLKEKQKINKISNIITFIYYIVLMFNMNIFARTNKYINYNLYPFKTIINTLTGNYSFYFKFINIIGNFIIYMPFSYFIPKLFPNIDKWYKNLLTISIIILLTEISQIIFKCGAFDIDDIILATTGNMLCYLFLSKYQKRHISV